MVQNRVQDCVGPNFNTVLLYFIRCCLLW